MHTEYDTVIIGTGMGGLSCGALLSKLYQQKVLVLESKSVSNVGVGASQKNETYEWVRGLYYIGGLTQGTPLRSIMDFITGDQVAWSPLSPPQEVFLFPDFNIATGSTWTAYQQQLIAIFPQEETAIKQYCQAIREVGAQFFSRVLDQDIPNLVTGIIHFFQLFIEHQKVHTLKEYFENHFHDKRLRAILATQWGDCDTPPKLSTMGIYALLMRFFSQELYYPVGGWDNLSKHIQQVIRQNGGEVLSSHRAQEIIIDHAQAKSVKVLTPDKIVQQVWAGRIISDMGVLQTFLDYIPRAFDLSFSEELKSITQEYSAVVLWIGLSDNPQSIGIAGNNLWLHDDYRYDDWDSHDEALMLGAPKRAFIAFPSMQDPQAQHHTALIIHRVDHQYYEQWENAKVMQDEQEYELLKTKISKGLLKLVERHLPGFGSLVDFQELETPLTSHNFSHVSSGGYFGISAIPERLSYGWLNPKTPVDSLYLTGADANALGIMGAMMGSIITTSAVMNESSHQLFQKLEDAS